MKAYGLSCRELFEQVDQGALKPLPYFRALSRSDPTP